VAKLTWSA